MNKTLTLDTIKQFNDEQLEALNSIVDAVEDAAKLRNLRNEDYTTFIYKMWSVLFSTDSVSEINEIVKYLTSLKHDTKLVG